MNSAYKLLLATIFLLVLGIAGLVCGMLADDWFVITGQYSAINFGLIRSCQRWYGEFGHPETVTCTQRSIQRFSEHTVWKDVPVEGKVLDEILTLLMAATSIGCIAFAFFAFMGLTMEKRAFRWRLTAVFGFFLTLLSAILSISACAISEGYLYKQLLMNDINVMENWTSTVCWCGSATQIIAALISLFVVFKTPDDDSNKDYSSTGHARPVYTVQSNVLHTTENLYVDALTALPDTVALSLDFFNIANEMPPPPSYAEARSDQGSPPDYYYENPSYTDV